MNLKEIKLKFNTHLKCVAHLEKARWNGNPICPMCDSTNITPSFGRKKSNRGRKRIHPENPYKTPKYHCNTCNRNFTVLKGTIFEGSRMPLDTWFTIITLMLNSLKGISAKQIQRLTGVTYKSAWYSAMRVRCAMLDQPTMLEGIVEMDEAYIGGKPKHRNKTPDGNEAYLSSLSTKRGRGTKKIPVVGIVERGGQKRVVTKVQDGLTGKDLLAMLKKYVRMDKAIVMTDEYRGYNAFDSHIQHLKVNHSAHEYVKDGIIHTNTIEGFWNIVKGGIRGQYHVLSKKYLPFYLAEFSYKYNRTDKKKGASFEETIGKAVSDEKCVVNYKPKKNPATLAYRKKKKKVKIG